MNNNPTPGEWIELCAVSDLPASGAGKYVNKANRSLAVFRAGDAGVKVIDDTCPHAGGSLSAGYCKDGVVHCPWHGWPFRIDDGKCPDNPNIRVRSYDVRVEDGKIHAHIPTPKNVVS